MSCEEDLIRCAACGDVDGVKEALLSGASPDTIDESGRTALHWVCQEGYMEILEILILQSAHVDQQDEGGFTPLVTAVGEDRLDMVKRLLQAGASPNMKVHSYEDGTALHLAASWGRTEVAKAIVDAGDVDINARDNDGKTPLAFARDAAATELIAYLIEHGAIV